MHNLAELYLIRDKPLVTARKGRSRCMFLDTLRNDRYTRVAR